MALFTIIVGSTYPEVSDEVAYVVDAINAEYGMMQAEAVAAGHNSGAVTTYFCMEGETRFYQKTPLADPVKVVDLRPVDPDTVSVACVGAEVGKLVEGLKGLPGTAWLPVEVDGYSFFVKPPSLTRAEMETQIKDILGRSNFTMVWAPMSSVQRRITSSTAA